ncbi:ppx/GppA family phosphatase [Actinomyces sp. Chiba101]|uniref:Ppx/GppA phosphatase family protein n=1 Tax=Actinomyces TaxID=1654 RepID=UPI000974DF13|nr:MULTISPECIES: Ppx/GppA phosphatase family protein [Actinomyces]BAW93967.1 ppx/GppA family phosphatase [Actinomyces sp. Chiba101]GAV93330.1 ppx/GppA family phosphatase [Actinomyces denticolens]SUU74467.1 Guanosine-5'-triphosphate,3'-diphosphate pyrophosphatase [Actinomyces denticolens]
MAPTRVAAIDCGTNTIRLLIADAHPDGGPTGRRLEKVERRSRIVRLGQGVDRTGRLDDGALERTLDVVADYAERIRATGAQRARFVATSATRDASNRDLFVNGVRKRLGIEPEVVSGDEEARLSFAGSLLGARGEGRRLVVDLGGGSTELVLGARAPEAAISLDTGSVRVTERYLADGVTPAAEAAARAHVRELLDRAEEVMDLGATEELVGLAGTITTITAHALRLSDFDPDSIHGSRLPLGTILASCEAILRSTAAERESWDYLRPGRRDVIAAGALVWSEVIGRVAERTREAGRPLESAVTSLTDILDGIALSLVEGGADRHD